MFARISVAALAASGALCCSSFAFAQADFAISYASEPFNTSLFVGDTISISYDVENNGTSASAVSVGFIIDDGISQAYLLYEDMIPSLPAFGFDSGTMTFQVPSGVDGTWYAGVVADPWQTVTETDEMDNAYLFTSRLTIGGGTTMPIITVYQDPLPAATVGRVFSATLRQSGATSPSWYVSSGNLPPGITLSTAGELYGTPTSAGNYSFVATASQIGYTPGTGSFSLNVTSGMSAISVTPAQLPEVYVGSPFEVQLLATGGSAPYGFQMIQPPAWLMMVGSGAEAGKMSGTPTETGQFQLTVYVIDSAGADATVMLALNVIESTALVVNIGLPSGQIGKPYSADLISGGTPPYTTQVTSGTLPPGLSIDPTTGMLSGVPTAMGNFEFEVSVTDVMSAQVSGRIQVPVTEVIGLNITTTGIQIYVNADADAPLLASGGVAPYTWQMIGGTLPPGLTFDSLNGKIVGRSGMVADETATFMVSDAEGSVAQSDVIVTVRLYRTSGGGGGKGGGHSGCTCISSSGARTYSSLFALALLALVFVRRRSR